MIFKIVYGKAGTGKTSYCFEQIKKLIENNRKVYIITPAQFSFTAEKNLMEILDEDAVINAEVISFERMAYRILNEVGGALKTNLTNCGKSMLLYNVLHRNTKNLNFLNKTDENIEVISNAITELKKHNVTIEQLKDEVNQIEDKHLKLKLEDILTVYKDYDANIKDKYIDENDLLTILAENLQYTNEYDNSYIFIDEFAGFTKQEYRIISQLMDTANVTVTIATDNLNQDVNPDTDIFYDNKKTVKKLLDISKEKNIKVESINLSTNKRFKNNELKHLEENLYAIPYKIYKDEIENIHLFLANNYYSEIENVARNIIRKMQEDELSYNDFAIITQNIDTYSNLIKAIFNKYEIPYFMDEKKDLNQNIVIKYLLSILEIFNQNWSYEAVFNYVKSGFLDIDNSDIFKLENYCINWGIKGNKWYKGDWKYGIIKKEDEAVIKRLNEIRLQIVNPILELKNVIYSNRTAKSITKYLYDFLIKNHIKEKLNEKITKLEELGHIDISKEYKAGWNILMDIFDELVLVFNEDKFTINEYTKILKVGIKNSELGKIPATQDQVIIGDVDRTRSHKVKYEFIIGINDGVFPSVNGNEGFLNDENREALKEDGIELAKTTLEKIYENNFNIYKAFTTAECELFLSYPSSDIEGNSLRPSMLISRIKNIFLQIVEESDILEKKYEVLTEKSTFQDLLENINQYFEGKKIDNVWFEIFAYYNSQKEWKDRLNKVIKALEYDNNPKPIEKELIDKLYGNNIKTSVSQLEKYKSCAFSYFLQYGLNLKEKKKLELKSIDTGSFMHDIIDTFFNTLIDEGIKPKEIENEELIRIINGIIDEKLKLGKNYIFTCTNKFKVQTNRLRRAIIQSIEYIIDEMKMSDFNMIGNEVEFNENKKYKPIKIRLESGKNVEIIGKIDRIDLAKSKNGNYIRIIDYKSSIKDINLNEVVSGIQLQLLTYLDATCKEEDILPAGVLYYNLIDKNISVNKKISEEELKKEFKKQYKMNGLILADMNVVKMMDNTLESGASSVIPANISKR